MQQFCTYGSVRGAVSNGRPYRDKTNWAGADSGACEYSFRGDVNTDSDVM
jgi:hypothetical protein